MEEKYIELWDKIEEILDVKETLLLMCYIKDKEQEAQQEERNRIKLLLDSFSLKEAVKVKVLLIENLLRTHKFSSQKDREFCRNLIRDFLGEFNLN